ncbi:DmsC/YnfH family molybdoenzyme membrane anchor subunit [Rhodopseudomonas pseudopalustris]|uniref:Phenylacetyl-CoA:acceptor oxidoreductase PadD subunit n=1 Tax=Rhodopseudomonas pseudopalustris TaxID=1513892 RepID=A0A1H8UHJ4_9BRAD|nr:DmsC/YnfH family molybdoenzyme membrane anchor subunit [Rhodopseudomonas pseudopalustris]SEP02690.1 phenylacetyl-CoA:acceptor oxidoreductase PadD subunit [Rhodopseudomonas pseudopalustris]
MSRPHKIIDRMMPRQQTYWDARAAINFICVGAGGGLLFVTALASPAADDLRPLLVLALALVGTGMTAVWFEIGRPLRAFNVYRNAATSWMTREAIIVLLLVVSAAAAIVFDQRAALAIAGLLGLAVAFAQGRILRAQKGIPAWRCSICVSMIVVSGLTEGAGLLSLAALYWPALLPFGILLAGLAGVRLLVWRNYLATLRRDGAPSGTLQAFAAIDRRFVWLGHALPMLLAVAGVVAGSSLLIALAGVLAAVAGGWFKYTLICRAGFTQGFALPRTPERGGGAAGAGIQPGWTRA